MPSIRVLPEAVARRIAAGEVVERPASVVKELVENSLDAGARHVTVELEQGGRERLVVTDDGAGMSREDLPVAFERHATSKVRSEEDLVRVTTLGFRGEALPSIGSVADVEVWTRHRDEAVGSRLRVRGGECSDVSDTGVAPGCRIEVRELFFNVPARRKFLRTATTESAHVSRILGQLALARSDVGFVLVHNGRETLSLPAGDLAARIRGIVGRDVGARMVPVEVDGPVRVRGFLGHPHVSLSSAKGVFFFVNGRAVRDRSLQYGLTAAYSSLLPQGRYPAAVLFLETDPLEVDVNVHPAKLEVRFRTPGLMHQALRRAVNEALGRRSYGGRAAEPVEVYDRTDRTTQDSPGSDPGAENERRAADGLAVPERSPGWPDGEGRLRLVPAGATASSGSASPTDSGSATREGFGTLRVVGQVFGGYVVCEGAGELVLIDQHAAHERVVFERLREERSRGQVEQQPLLVPEAVSLGRDEAEALLAVADSLKPLGFEIESFGERDLVVRSVPALFGTRAVAPLLRDLAADLVEVEGSRAVDEWTERLLATIACHSVVRVGQGLSVKEIEGLLEALDRIRFNTNCPHGRPVFLSLSRSFLERRLGR